MSKHIEGLHHHQLQKNTHSTDLIKWKPFIDQTIYIVGLIGPIMTIPQLTKIWIEKNAMGVSAISWTTYIIVSAFWILYGIVHKEKALIIISSIWIILEFFIVIGTLKYG